MKEGIILNIHRISLSQINLFWFLFLIYKSIICNELDLVHNSETQYMIGLQKCIEDFNFIKTSTFSVYGGGNFWWNITKSFGHAWQSQIDPRTLGIILRASTLNAAINYSIQHGMFGQRKIRLYIYIYNTNHHCQNMSSLKVECNIAGLTQYNKVNSHKTLS